LPAVITGADDYPGMVECGRDREPQLRQFLALSHGVAPAVGTFCRLFAAIKPKALDDVLRRRSTELFKTRKDRRIAVDGQTLRRSFEHARKKLGLHVVTAGARRTGWCSGRRRSTRWATRSPACPGCWRQ
jgi:hypothetical protein